VLNLLKSYLRKRRLRARVNTTYSEWTELGMINSGVPQGSILGPLLFLLYINDLNEVVEHCRLYLYSDDCSLFIPVKHDEDVRISHDKIQQGLNNMAAWSKRWKLNSKANKSAEVIFRVGAANRIQGLHWLANT
jgi:hypothetical protein